MPDNMKQLNRLPQESFIKSRPFLEVHSLEEIMDAPSDTLLVTHDNLTRVMLPLLKATDPYALSKAKRLGNEAYLEVGNVRYGFVSDGTRLRTVWIHVDGHKRWVQDTWSILPMDRDQLGPEPLEIILTRIRSDLREVEMEPVNHIWWRPTAILERLIDFNECDVEASDWMLNTLDQPEDQLMGCWYIGYSDQPTYWYDMHRAYLHYLKEIPEFREIGARIEMALQVLGDKPLSRAIVKLLYQTIVGRMIGKKTSPKHRNPWIGHYIVRSTRNRLTDAMEILNRLERAKVYHCAVDGFAASQPTDALDFGDQTGQWSLEVQPDLIIVRNGFYWSGEKHKHGGLPRGCVTREMVYNHLTEFGFESLPLKYHRFDWSSMDWIPMTYPLNFEHDGGSCGTCINSSRKNPASALQLHERLELSDLGDYRL